MVASRDKDIMPEYLRFVRGVLESDDLPLNISRETLQENPHMFKIKNTVVSKFLAHLQDLAKNDQDKFKTFWKQHGRIFKEGYNDFTNKDKIADLFRFNSSKCKDAEELVSLMEYVDKMHEKQEEIYYISGPDRETLDNNPSVEIFKAKEIEVLYCFDPIDEFALPGLIEFKDKKIISVDQVDLKKLSDIPSTEDGKKEKKPKVEKKEMDLLARRIKDILGDKVEDVKLSERLVDSPAVLLNAEGGMSSQMEKIMRVYNPEAKAAKKVMEINTNHSTIQNMLAIYKNDAKDKLLVKISNNLYHSVALLEGSTDDPHEMAAHLQDILSETTSLYLKEQPKKKPPTPTS
jgi:molecular chaperone HtpG